MPDSFKRFTESYIPEPNSGCWLWIRSTDWYGYAGLSINGRRQGAHRYAYMAFVGEIPEGLVLDHLCRVRCCVNPGHLQAVTIAENIRRGDTGIHGRIKTHCKNGHPLSGSNLAMNGSRRRCLACTKQWNDNRKLRHGEVA